jgi:hypothetical protein
MRVCYESLEQELRGLRRLLATATTPKSSTTHASDPTVGGSHGPHLEKIRNQFVTTIYPYVLFAALLTMTAFFVKWALWEKMTFVRVPMHGQT